MFSSDENVLDEVGDGTMLQCDRCEGGDVVIVELGDGSSSSKLVLLFDGDDCFDGGGGSSSS